MCMRHKIGDTTVRFLVDTGAAISTIKPEILSQLNYVKTYKEKIEINGISDQKLEISEYTELPIRNNISHKFYMVFINIPYESTF